MAKRNEEVKVVHEVIINGDEYISSTKASELLNLTPRHIAYLCREAIEGRGEWRAVRVGSTQTWFILKDDVVNYETHKVGPKST